MTDTTTAPAGGADAIVSVPVSTPADPDNSPISATEAARQLSSWRAKRDNPDTADESAAQAEEPADTNSAQAEGDPQTDEAPAETTETQDAAEESLPPVEPPRSWTKEQKDRWASLPRDTQEYVSAREQERERELRRGQNEAAEKLKVLEAERQQVTEARQRYEQALPELLRTMQDQQQGDFADIRTMADVERLAAEDFPRYVRWDAAQKKIAAVTQEVKAAQERQAQDYTQQWSAYATKQDQLLIDLVPELSDKAKSQKIGDAAAATLRDVGFDDKELADLWSGKGSVSLRDARLGQLIIEASRYREAKASTAKTAKPNVPPVQRPGSSKPPARSADQEIQALEKRFNSTGNWKDGAALLNARRRAG